MAAEAGEDEFLGRGVPVEVDGHAGPGVESSAEGDVEGEEADFALVHGRVVLGVVALGSLPEVATEVPQAERITPLGDLTDFAELAG